MNIIFAGATPINLQKVNIPVSFVFAYARPIAQCYRHEKYLFLPAPLHGFVEDLVIALIAQVFNLLSFCLKRSVKC